MIINKEVWNRIVCDMDIACTQATWMCNIEMSIVMQ